MRFRYGPPPEAPDRDFENAGWKKIATPPVRRLFLWSLPITLVVFLLTYLGWRLLFTGEILELNWEILDLNWIIIIGAIFFVAPFHELTHAVLTPIWGLYSHTILGLWLPKAAFYVYYTEPLSKIRFLVILAAPFILLTAFPLTVGGISRVFSPLVFYLTLGNALTCGADLLQIPVICCGIPHNALLLLNGCDTWWKVHPENPD